MSAQLLDLCGVKRFYAFGTAKIFERRANSIEIKRNWITYLGIMVPLLVGASVLAFGTKALPYLLVPAGLLGLLQLSLSVWSLVAKWDARHTYALSAAQAQTRLFNAWDALIRRPPPDLEIRIAELDVDDQEQEQSDLTQNISGQEKRFAMRSSLYFFGSNCRACGRKPASMMPSQCDTCGNF